jgi:hypothetical protein
VPCPLQPHQRIEVCRSKRQDIGQQSAKADFVLLLPRIHSPGGDQPVEPMTPLTVKQTFMQQAEA